MVCYYNFDAFDHQSHIFKEEFDRFLEQNNLMIYLDFLLFMFIILFMFIFATFFVLKNFNAFIHNIKRMMTIVPAHYIQVLEIKKSFEKLS